MICHVEVEFCRIENYVIPLLFVSVFVQ